MPTDPFEPPFNAANNDWNHHDEDRDRARQAALLGCLSMFLGMIGFCTCYAGFPAAVVVGIIAYIMSSNLLEHGPTGETLAYSNVARGTSIAGIIYSGLIVVLIIGYIMVLGGMMAFA